MFTDEFLINLVYFCYRLGVKCPAINAPSNGMISPAQCKNKSGVNYETKCFFMCNVTNGYQLEGPSSVSCLEDGSWSANINKTTCKGMLLCGMWNGFLVKPGHFMRTKLNKGRN